MASLHDFRANRLEGEEQPLADYAGKALLVVNVASKCGLTPHYAGLEQLYQSHRERGLEILGFPCNQFGGQEPGSAEEIRSFCQTNYGVSFPLFAKIEVNGAGRHPVYDFLTRQASEPEGPGEIAWNFAKFVVGKDGAVVARFGPATEPDAPELLEAIEKAL
jgi:glutathione peroxidase